MEVLEFLRRKQAASAEVISAQLGITPNAVRQHLASLEREGLVYPGDEHVIMAGARPIIEYLAACACVRRPATGGGA